MSLVSDRLFCLFGMRGLVVWRFAMAMRDRPNSVNHGAHPASGGLHGGRDDTFAEQTA